MSQVKPDCYCLGGNMAHYSEAKYQSLQRTYEQARDEAKHLYGECLMLADVLRDALEKIADWNGCYGPFPESNNELWRGMAIVTAREAAPNPNAIAGKGVEA